MRKVFYLIGGEIGTFILFLFYTNLFPVPPGRAGKGQEWDKKGGEQGEKEGKGKNEAKKSGEQGEKEGKGKNEAKKVVNRVKRRARARENMVPSLTDTITYHND